MATDIQNLPVSRAVTPETGRARPDFSICTLVSDPAQHAGMLQAFHAAGFTGPDCEFLHIDNSGDNQGDGYRGLNLLIGQAEGRYLVLCHQDIRPMDDRATLTARLQDLGARHPDWAVAGNAGFDDRHRPVLRITDRHMLDARTPGLPLEIASLDENLLILRREALLGFSHDLSGFHLYGTDIVCQARLRGWRAFVIDFHVEHLGRGSKGPSFIACRTALIAKYRRALRSRRVRTPSTWLVIGPGQWVQRARVDIPEYLRGIVAGPPLQRGKRYLLELRERLHGNRYVLDGLSVQVPPEAPATLRRALRRGDYRAAERGLVRSHLAAGRPVLQLGAGIGVVSQALRRQLDAETALVVVDADPARLDLCRTNLGHVPSDGPTRLVTAALSHGGPEAPPSMASGQAPHAAPADGAGMGARAMTLAALLREGPIQGPYALVCDIGGAEWDLLTRDAGALAMCETLILTLHPGALMDRGHSVGAVLGTLAALGMTVVALQDRAVCAVRRP